jgi:hypothetical protein
MTTSATSKTKDALMLLELRMKKEPQLVLQRRLRKPNRDGELFILTRLMMNKTRDFPRTSDSISTDHSTSDQE